VTLHAQILQDFDGIPIKKIWAILFDSKRYVTVYNACRNRDFVFPVHEIVFPFKEINMNKIRLLVFSVFVLMVWIAPPAFAADKVPLRAQDRVEIEQLMWDYIRALDSGNAEAYAALFTPDGQFGRGAAAVKGREALKKMVSDARQKRDADNKSGKSSPRMFHIVTNPHIEFVDENHARYYAYWMGAFASGGSITSAGREVNELVRINGQWLIHVRDVDPQD
jgi:uncharacterized protein (TIGR02246 family)